MLSDLELVGVMVGVCLLILVIAAIACRKDADISRR
jgi:hypothetical protein